MPVHIPRLRGTPEASLQAREYRDPETQISRNLQGPGLRRRVDLEVREEADRALKVVNGVENYAKTTSPKVPRRWRTRRYFSKVRPNS